MMETAESCTSLLELWTTSNSFLAENRVTHFSHIFKIKEFGKKHEKYVWYTPHNTTTNVG